MPSFAESPFEREQQYFVNDESSEFLVEIRRSVGQVSAEALVAGQLPSGCGLSTRYIAHREVAYDGMTRERLMYFAGAKEERLEHAWRTLTDNPRHCFLDGLGWELLVVDGVLSVNAEGRLRLF